MEGEINDITVLARFTDGKVVSVDEHGRRRITSSTVFNMCKRVGFPRFSEKFEKILISQEKGEMTIDQFFNEMAGKLYEGRNPVIR